MDFPFPQTRARMEAALADRQGSALALAVARGNAEPHTLLLGKTAQADSGGISAPIGADSLFDLASLTKALGFLPLLIEAMREGPLQLSDPVAKFFPGFAGGDVRVEHLLRHNSGYVAHEEFYRRPSAQARGYLERAELVDWIVQHPRTPLAEAKTVYSDLGILLAGFLVEELYGKTIAELFELRTKGPLGLRETGFRVLPHAPKAARAFHFKAAPERFVATAQCGFHGRLLQGEVDDNNCWALGGYSAHAGLFSTLAETVSLLRHSVQAAQRFHSEFFPNASSKPPFTQGYMLYPGLRPIATDEWKGAIGHTGFVGTSAWYHEPTDTYVVLLGNRVHPQREDTRFVETRLEIHRILWSELK